MKPWAGTRFAKLVKRLEKEMPESEIAKLFKRDADGEGDVDCAYCLAHIPPALGVGPHWAYCYHHLEPRGMGGGSPNAVSNLTPICGAHHLEPIQSFRELGQRVMVATGKAKTADYPSLDFGLSPLVTECLGMYGAGTDYYNPDGIPPIVQRIFCGYEDKRINDYCLLCCPRTVQCITETKIRILKLLRG